MTATACGACATSGCDLTGEGCVVLRRVAFVAVAVAVAVIMIVGMSVIMRVLACLLSSRPVIMGMAVPGVVVPDVGVFATGLTVCVV